MVIIYKQPWLESKCNIVYHKNPYSLPGLENETSGLESGRQMDNILPVSLIIVGASVEVDRKQSVGVWSNVKTLVERIWASM
jgi:hypothetical protein